MWHLLRLAAATALIAPVALVAVPAANADSPERTRSQPTWTSLGLGFTSGYVVSWGEPGRPLAAPPLEVTRDYVLQDPTRRVVSVETGQDFTLALTRAGRVIAWGVNDAGQSSVPSEAQSGVVKIVAGARHAYALRSDGRLVAWGSNECGQTSLPQEVMANVVDVASADCSGMAVLSDGSLVTLGNPYGIAAGRFLVPPEAQSDVRRVFMPGYQSAVLKRDGSIVAWMTGCNNQQPPECTYSIWKLPPSVRGDVRSIHLAPQSFAQIGDDTWVVWSRMDVFDDVVVGGYHEVSGGWTEGCALSLTTAGTMDYFRPVCRSSKRPLSPVPAEAKRYAVAFDWSYRHAAAVIGVADAVPAAPASAPEAFSHKKREIVVGLELWPTSGDLALQATRPGWPEKGVLRADTWIETRVNGGAWIRSREREGSLRENHIHYPKESVGFAITLKRVPAKGPATVEVRLVNSAGPGPTSSASVFVK